MSASRAPLPEHACTIPRGGILVKGRGGRVDHERTHGDIRSAEESETEHIGDTPDAGHEHEHEHEHGDPGHEHGPTAHESAVHDHSSHEAHAGPEVHVGHAA